jgi:hypothetical protein
VKISGVIGNNRKRTFEVRLGSRTLPFPYAKCRPSPASEDRVVRVYPDPEIGREGFTYVLESGREGTVHGEQVLEYNKDPGYMRDQILYRLTLEAQKRIDSTPLSKREVIRRLGTSATQFYRLLDPTNTRKSIDQLLSLLSVLGCRVDLIVRAKSA